MKMMVEGKDMTAVGVARRASSSLVVSSPRRRRRSSFNAIISFAKQRLGSFESTEIHFCFSVLAFIASQKTILEVLAATMRPTETFYMLDDVKICSSGCRLHNGVWRRSSQRMGLKSESTIFVLSVHHVRDAIDLMTLQPAKRFMKANALKEALDTVIGNREVVGNNISSAAMDDRLPSTPVSNSLEGPTSLSQGYSERRRRSGKYPENAGSLSGKHAEQFWAWRIDESSPRHQENKGVSGSDIVWLPLTTSIPGDIRSLFSKCKFDGNIRAAVQRDSRAGYEERAEEKEERARRHEIMDTQDTSNSQTVETPAQSVRDLEQLYDRNTLSIYGRQSQLDFSSRPIPVVLSWLNPLQETDDSKTTDVTIANIQDWTNNPNVVNSYGLRCIIDDIRLRGRSELPQDPSKTFSVKSVHIYCTFVHAVQVKIKIEDGEGGNYNMFIRYDWGSLDEVIGILKCRPLPF
ncbi:hypothetical protein SCHPADRAFT_975702 [Schizopora paradoxa]|uniref:Uncharacterized protein n=1 Tax=Schizopora paradoxa TaxID=27342 RepID=A0A0H2RHU2_9AGAM|nr:hypothetical protein SCHPADRAFT_975702 [Schizopora paradoxa]